MPALNFQNQIHKVNQKDWEYNLNTAISKNSSHGTNFSLAKIYKTKEAIT